MALFLRAIKPIPAAHRAYSSFFSSKSGGGRYFNSAKPPKSVVPASSGVSKAKADASRSGSADADAGHESQGTGSGSNNGNKGTPEASSSNPVVSTHDPQSQSSPASTSSFTPNHYTFPIHPTMNSKDYKLHQFFSLHRPLLLLTQPTSVIFESSRKFLPLTSSQDDTTATEAYAVPPGGLDDPPEASPEADADTARQLVRALVINRTGATIAWEHTLRRLGLDVDLEEGREGLKAQWAKEWEDVMMDSTKRKRKRKMKKHKLKKRRKATRAQRIKIGR